jgi:hypothetical protein
MDTEPVEAIARRHGVELIPEFGSIVTWRVHPRGDVDLAVLFDRPMVAVREWAAPATGPGSGA